MWPGRHTRGQAMTIREYATQWRAKNETGLVTRQGCKAGCTHGVIALDASDGQFVASGGSLIQP